MGGRIAFAIHFNNEVMKHIGFCILFLVFAKCSEIGSKSLDFDSEYENIYALFNVDFEMALAKSDSLLIHSQDHRVLDQEAYIFYIKGYIYEAIGDNNNAVFSYLNSLKCYEEIANKSIQGAQIDVLIRLGNTFGKYHKHYDAIEFYERGLELISEDQDQRRKLMLLYSKSYDLRQSKQENESIDILKEASSLSNELGDTTMIIKCFNLLGLTHKDNGFLDEAKEYYQYILDLPTATDKDRARALHNTAIAYGEEGNSEKAKIYFENALALKRKIRDKKLLFTTLFDLSEWHLSYGSLDSANRLAKQAELLYPKLLCEPESFKIYHLLSEISAKRGDYQESKFYADLAYDEALKFNDSTREIMEQKDKFQIDLILAGFNAEQEAQDQRFKATLNRWLIAILLVGCVIAYLAWRIWFRRWRTDLWNRIYACSIGIQERS